jgi:hypothetical protein
MGAAAMDTDTMSTDERDAGEGVNAAGTPAQAVRKPLRPAAQRALAEAAERARQQAESSVERPREIHGRKGPEPTRYGDWERNGILSDF